LSPHLLVPVSSRPLVLDSPHPPSAPSPQGEGLSNLALGHLLNSPCLPFSLSPRPFVLLSSCLPVSQIVQQTSDQKINPANTPSPDSGKPKIHWLWKQTLYISLH
jgi:hypothetical protein